MCSFFSIPKGSHICPRHFFSSRRMWAFLYLGSHLQEHQEGPWRGSREACSAPVSPISPGFPPERTCLRMGVSYFRSWARSLLPKSQDPELREWGPRLAVLPAPLVLLVVPFAFLLFPSPPGSEVRTGRTLFSPQLFHQLSA